MPGKSRRKLRNFLLHRSLQLKLAAYAMGLTLLGAALIGAFLFRTTGALFDQTQRAVDARAEAAKTSRELSNAALLERLLSRFDDPSFEKVLRDRSQEIDRHFQAEATAIARDRAELVRRQRITDAVLAGALLVLVLLAGLAAIVVTHRFVGPLHRVRQLMRQIEAGSLALPTHPLRRGDDLQELFADLTRMIAALRTEETTELEQIARALGGNARADEALAALRERKTQRLGVQARDSSEPVRQTA